MPGPNKRVQAPKLSDTPMSDDKDTARVKARVDAGASASEIAEEAYRICRINGYLRGDIQRAKETLRACGQAKKKQAVMEDALDELRDETRKTRGLLERAWGLLEQRNVKIPADLEMAYNALRTEDPHEWRARKRMNYGVRRQQRSKKGAKAKQSKAGSKTKKKKEGEQVTTFLLHTHEGRTQNMRDPITDDDTDEDMDSATAEPDHASGHDDTTRSPPPAKPSAAAPATTAPQQGGLTANNVVAGTKRKTQPNTRSFVASKKPKLTEGLEDGEIDESTDADLEEGEIRE